MHGPRFPFWIYTIEIFCGCWDMVPLLPTTGSYRKVFVKVLRFSLFSRSLNPKWANSRCKSVFGQDVGRRKSEHGCKTRLMVQIGVRQIWFQDSTGKELCAGKREYRYSDDVHTEEETRNFVSTAKWILYWGIAWKRDKMWRRRLIKIGTGKASNKFGPHTVFKS